MLSCVRAILVIGLSGTPAKGIFIAAVRIRESKSYLLSVRRLRFLKSTKASPSVSMNFSAAVESGL